MEKKYLILMLVTELSSVEAPGRGRAIREDGEHTGD